MEQLNIGVIGLGMMGGIFSQVVNDSPFTRLAAVCDVDAARVTGFAEKYGAAPYGDYKEMLDKEALDCVFVCTPDNLHLGPIVEITKRGKHHVFLEKPLAADYAEAKEIAALAEKHPKTFMVGHTLRYDPRMNRAWEAIGEGRLGRMVHMRTWRQTCVEHALRLAKHSNSMFFIGIHDIDAMLWLNRGANVKRVYAEAVKVKMPELGYDVPDSIFALLRFDNGVIATHNSSWILPKTQGQTRSNTLHAGFELLGTDGVINLEMHDPGVIVQTYDQIYYPPVFYHLNVQGSPYGVYKEEAYHFIKCVTEGKKPATVASDSLRAVEIADAIDRSWKMGVVVDL